MRRFFAGIIALFLLTSAICFPGFSEASDTVTANGGGRLPARYGTITADGTAEAAMAYDTPILKDHSGYITLGATWDDTTLAIGAISEQVVLNVQNQKLASRTNGAIDSMTVTVANGIYTYTPADGLKCVSGAALSAGTVYGANNEGYLVELKLPISAIRAYRNTSGEVCADITVIATIGEVTERFDGYVVFSANKVTHSYTLAGASDSLMGAHDHKDHAASPKVNEKGLSHQVKNFKNDVNVHEYDVFGWNKSESLMAEDIRSSVSFDFEFDFALGDLSFKPTSAPNQTEKAKVAYNQNSGYDTTQNGMRALIYIGLGEGTCDGYRLASPSQFLFAIHHTVDGLKLYYDDGNSPYGGDGIALNRETGVTFNLTFEWLPNGDNYDVSIFVDGEVVGTLSVPAQKRYDVAAGRGIKFGLGSVGDVTQIEDEELLAANENKLAVFSYRNPVICEYVAEYETKIEKLLEDYGILQDNCFQKSGVGADGMYAIRFLTTIEDFLCDAYAEVGFEAVAVRTDGTESNPIERRTNKVYSTIVADDETVSAPNGTYWVAVAVNGIPADAAVTFVIRPFAVTENGEKHYGAVGKITLPYTSN